MEPTPILQGGSAVSDEPTWHVVLSHGRLMGNLRHAAPLTVDISAGTARWESAPWALDIREFPRDLAGIEDHFPWFPRGLTKAEILDHHPDLGWWLRLDDNATVVPALLG